MPETIDGGGQLAKVGGRAAQRYAARMRRLLLVTMMLAACSDPLELDWTYDIGAGSVSTPLVTQGFIAFGHERGISLLEPSGVLRCNVETRGEVVSRPVTDGTLIYATCTDYTLYAFDPTCRVVWKFAARDRMKSDAWVGDGRVVVSSYDGHVYALDTKGRLAWSFPPPQAPRGGDFSYSSPAVVDGVVFVGSLDGTLYGLNATTGEQVFRFTTGAAVTSSPRVQDGVVYFGSNDGNVYALASDGVTERWRFATGGWVNSSPTLDTDSVYVGSNDRHVYALDRTSGALRWRFAARGPVIAIPALYANLVIAAGGSGDGTLYAIDKSDGALFWSHATRGKIESDPVIEGDHLYVTSTDKTLYAFKIRRTRRAEN
jgi:eukaryotic-like serine/threonine-protein kinase